MVFEMELESVMEMGNIKEGVQHVTMMTFEGPLTKMMSRDRDVDICIALVKVSLTKEMQVPFDLEEE